jgi:4-hydroxybenzoate polyprenyltransferase
LVTLRQLAAVGFVVVLIQLTITFLLGRQLLPFLVAAWILMALMSQEFFVAEWLRARPILYMLSHMFILPLIDFYLLDAAWQGEGAPPIAFACFLVATYTNGIVFEIGRKVRAAEDEEVGVETYSVLWGIPRATLAWLLAVVIAGTAGILAGWSVGASLRASVAITIVILLVWGAAAWVAWRMIQQPTSKNSGWIERLSGIWVLLFYLSLGLLPHWR